MACWEMTVIKQREDRSRNEGSDVGEEKQMTWEGHEKT